MKPSPTDIYRILCPTDISPRSQLALNFASGIASRLSAEIIACHCVPATWFTPDRDSRKSLWSEIERKMRDSIATDRNGSAPKWRPVVIEDSIDPARDILSLAERTNVNLIVMKARRGVKSALHYGSMVQRITRKASVPVLLLPTRFLDALGPAAEIDFRNVLFDYDFSETTDRLFPIVTALTKGFHADLHLLTVLEPPAAAAVEYAGSGTGRDRLQLAEEQKLLGFAGTGYGGYPVVGKWGEYAEIVLKYADEHNIDLICTTLAPNYFYLEKFYCTYLGQLLRSAKCPILVLRSV
jgi:nucleotide-binding universal stress UspA family protein